jgi:uncharacterized protein (TIGR02145 family)
MNDRIRTRYFLVMMIGSEIIFSCFSFNSIAQTSSITCKDIDGNVYNSIKIGTQQWMSENLKTTKYNDGTSIPNVKVNASWSALNSGAYCDYANIPANATLYGRLYNWYVVASTNPKKVCPKGWHVPTDSEWSILINYLGGERNAGGKLKETGTTHWNSSNTGVTNESGFTALPGGYRTGSGLFSNIRNDGTWWSSTGYNNKYAWDRHMHCDYLSIGRWGIDKKSAFSIRCVKN